MKHLLIIFILSYAGTVSAQEEPVQINVPQGQEIFEGPLTPPEVNFVEPTTPPPYDNSPQKKQRWWEKISTKVADMWSWIF